MKKFPTFENRGSYSKADFNKLLQEVERLSKISAQYPLELLDSPAGPAIRFANTQIFDSFWARLTAKDTSGGRIKYSWSELQLNDDGSTEILSGGRSGTASVMPGFEINGVDVDIGNNVHLTPGNGNYFFIYPCPCVVCSCIDECSVCSATSSGYQTMSNKWTFTASGFSGDMDNFNGDWTLEWASGCTFTKTVGTVTVTMEFVDDIWRITFVDSSNDAYATYTLDDEGACAGGGTIDTDCCEGVCRTLKVTFQDSCFDGLTGYLTYVGYDDYLGLGPSFYKHKWSGVIATDLACELRLDLYGCFPDPPDGCDISFLLEIHTQNCDVVPTECRIHTDYNNMEGCSCSPFLLNFLCDLTPTDISCSGLMCDPVPTGTLFTVIVECSASIYECCSPEMPLELCVDLTFPSSGYYTACPELECSVTVEWDEVDEVYFGRTLIPGISDATWSQYMEITMSCQCYPGYPCGIDINLDLVAEHSSNSALNYVAGNGNQNPDVTVCGDAPDVDYTQGHDFFVTSGSAPPPCNGVFAPAAHYLFTAHVHNC